MTPRQYMDLHEADETWPARDYEVYMDLADYEATHPAGAAGDEEVAP